MHKSTKFLFKRLLLVFFCLNGLVSMEIDLEESKENRSLVQTFSNVDCTGCRDGFVQGAKYVCELGAEVLVSAVVVGTSVALLSVASSLQAQGEEQGAHYETRSRYVCSYDSDGNKSCRTERYTECVGPYEACRDLDAASTLFAIGGLGILGTGVFWVYKFYYDYERYCLGRREHV